MDSRRPAAFFDLDRTLIEFNSGLSYARAELKAGRINHLILARAMVSLVMYHLSVINMRKAYNKMLSHYRGVSAELLDDRTRRWFDDAVASELLPGARAILGHHRELGHPNVILTNSSCYVARIAAERWEMDGWIANHFEVDADGRLEGTFEEPLCYGSGKIARAESWASERDVDVSASYFYTDSYSDVPMLERVANPRVVNPDPRLRRYARKAGWPILDWRDVAQHR